MSELSRRPRAARALPGLAAAVALAAAAVALPRPRVVAAAPARPAAPADTGAPAPAQAAPLYVVDGQEVATSGRRAPDGSPAELPPADRIARVDVLKGEAAAAYGARGRHGVVRITTRAGARGPS